MGSILLFCSLRVLFDYFSKIIHFWCLDDRLRLEKLTMKTLIDRWVLFLSRWLLSFLKKAKTLKPAFAFFWGGGGGKQDVLPRSWKFFHDSARCDWFLRGHMTSNNETVSRQNLWAATLQSLWRHREQCIVTRECWPTTTVTARFYEFPAI